MEEIRNLTENENIGDGPNAQRIVLHDTQPGPSGDGPRDNRDREFDNVENEHDVIELLRHMYSFRLLCTLIRRSPMRLQVFIEQLAEVNYRLATQLRENYQALHQLVYEDIHSVQQDYGENEAQAQEADLAQTLENEISTFIANLDNRRQLHNGLNDNNDTSAAEPPSTDQYVFWLINEVVLALSYATGQINEEDVPAQGVEYHENVEITLDEVIVHGNEVVAEHFEDEQQRFVHEQNDEIEVEWDFEEPNVNVVTVLSNSDGDEQPDLTREPSGIRLEESSNKDVVYFDTSTHNDHNYALESPSNTTITVGQNLERELSFSISNTSLPESASPTETLQEMADNEIVTSTTGNTSYVGTSSTAQQYGQFPHYLNDENVFNTKGSTNSSNVPFNQNYTENLANINETDQASIQRLCGMGFPEDMVVQAYYACHRNEGNAASFLMSYL